MTPLRCNACGLVASGDLLLVARAGGTHYRRIDHGVGIPGRRSTQQARTCGTWIEIPPEEPRNG